MDTNKPKIKIKERIKSKMTILDHMLNFNDARVAYFAKPTFIDRIWEKTILYFVPFSIRPNYLTMFRFLTIPVIIYFLLIEQYFPATVIFLFSAFSDTIDGAVARTRNKITTWGTLFDPLADKLLIGSVAIIVVAKYVSVVLATIIVVMELSLAASAYFRFTGKVVPAKTVGKIKMVLECFGIFFLLFSITAGIPIFLVIGKIFLYVAVLFAFLSLFVYRSI